jgi:tRNA-2-methylthio-N6-dimethylallyladenosine synthase
MASMKKIYMETFGCQMNVLDSELVEGQLKSLGYSFTSDIEAAQVVLYNTCSVRELSEQKVLSRLGRLRVRKQDEPDLVIGVIGCMAERDGAGMMRRLPHVDLMCGPSELDKLPNLLENVLLTGKQQHALAGNTSRRSGTLHAAREGGEDGLELLDLSRSFSATENKYQAYIRIVRGCNKFCTYCVVPYTRGAEVSRSPQAIRDEARKLVDAGCLEITLLGQTVNHYVHEETISTSEGPTKRRTTFAELLQQLHDELPELPRLRFLTSFPADFGDDILQVMAACPRICKYLHIPGQSGSNRILKMMNRGYTIESYLELLERARRIVPEIIFAGDVIVGFPTETDEDYQATRRMVQEARYKNCYIFKYSARPGTVAIKRYEDDVPDEVKRARNNDLLKVQNDICTEINRELVGKTVDVLCEGPSGWSKGEDSVVAGARGDAGTTDSQGAKVSSGKVEVGSRLATAMSAARLEIKGLEDAVQMTGRTTADQIVVFKGARSLEGQIVPVRVHAAHGMTIFAEVEQTETVL